MVVIHELGLASQIECVRTPVSMFRPVDSLFADNPLNKIPTLILDDGSALFDSRVICEYLDTLSDAIVLFPAAGSERFAALRDHALGDGVIDVCMLRLMESLKPQEQRSPEIIDSNERKCAAALERLEADAGRLQDREYDIGHVAIGVALGYLDFRFASDEWRNGCPRLAQWYESFQNRAAVQACPVVDDR